MFVHLAGYQEDETGTMKRQHPAEPVAYFLGSNNEANNNLRLKQVELWYQQYQAKRGLTSMIFKSASSIVSVLAHFPKVNDVFIFCTTIDILTGFSPILR